MAKCNLGKVKFKTMPVSGRLRGDLLSSLVGAPSGLHRICLLAGLCERSFCSLIFKPFPLSSLPLVSIGSGKYSTDWVQCDSALGGGHLQCCHGYLLPRALSLPGSTNLFGHQLPSSLLMSLNGPLASFCTLGEVKTYN